MNEAVAAVLGRIVASYGAEVSEDPRRVEALLRDLSGEHRREISVLSGAAREGIPAELLSQAGTVPPAILAERLARTLENNLGMADAAARWAIATWAAALGLDGFAAHRMELDQGPDPGTLRPGSAAEPLRTAVPPSLAPQQLRVSKLGAADHRTIGAALTAAEAGARIMVRPGIYRESLVLSQPVELVADGPGGDVVIEGISASNCLVMDGDMALVRGFTLRQAAGINGEFSVVSIEHGHLVLDGCDINSAMGRGIRIAGSGTSAMISHCQMRAAKTGIFVIDHGMANLEDCEIWANQESGVYIETSNAVFRRCAVNSSGWAGIRVIERGTGEFEDCEILGGKAEGVLIESGGSPILRRCKIHQAARSGLLVSEGAGVLEDCEIFENEVGALIADQSTTVMRRCKIHHNQGAGILFIDNKTGGVAEDCEIWGNEFLGIGIGLRANPVVRRCEIHHNDNDGVAIDGRAAGVVEECEIWGNNGYGVSIEDHADPVVRRCKIRDNEEEGVAAVKKSAGLVEDCNIQGNAGGAEQQVVIGKGCKTRVR
jgi:Right handed beta helix region